MRGSHKLNQPLFFTGFSFATFLNAFLEVLFRAFGLDLARHVYEALGLLGIVGRRIRLTGHYHVMRIVTCRADRSRVATLSCISRSGPRFGSSRPAAGALRRVPSRPAQKAGTVKCNVALRKARDRIQNKSVIPRLAPLPEVALSGPSRLAARTSVMGKKADRQGGRSLPLMSLSGPAR